MGKAPTSERWLSMTDCLSLKNKIYAYRNIAEKAVFSASVVLCVKNELVWVFVKLIRR